MCDLFTLGPPPLDRQMMARAELVIAGLCRQRGFSLQRLQRGYRLSNQRGTEVLFLSLGRVVDTILETTPLELEEPPPAGPEKTQKQHGGRLLAWQKFVD